MSKIEFITNASAEFIAASLQNRRPSSHDELEQLGIEAAELAVECAEVLEANNAAPWQPIPESELEPAMAQAS